MNLKKIITATVALVFSGLLFADNNQVDPNINRFIKGDRLSMGNGYFQAYSRFTSSGKPKAIVVRFKKSTLHNLPREIPNDGKTCYDLNNDDEIDLHNECVGGHSRTLYINHDLTPFNNVTINWEPDGHDPDGIYNKAHFDFHFYLTTDIDRKKIMPGICDGLMNCTQTQEAILPVPLQYIHSDYINTELAFAHMGNHYVDSTAPELNDGDFTHTFIIGTYNSQITFYEPMVTREYLLTKPNICSAIKQPDAFEKSGYYPTKYCVRYNHSKEMYRVSLERFQYQTAE